MSVPKILVIGLSTPSHLNEPLSGVLMGYLMAQQLDDVTLIGSSPTTGTQPNYFTLSTFPWSRLAEYDVLVILGPLTASTPEDTEAKATTATYVRALTEFVREGKGCVTLHLAAAFFHEAFTQMIGGRFLTHPPIQPFTIQVDDPHHPITQGIPAFTVMDELYITDHDPAAIHILLSAAYEGKQRPMAWVKTYGAGRVAYIAPGHDFRTFLHPVFLQLVEQAVRWAGQSV